MVEGTDDLLHGGLAVGAVGVNQVDVLEIETLQGGIDTLDDVLSGETQVVGGVVAIGLTPVNLQEDERGQR